MALSIDKTIDISGKAVTFSSAYVKVTSIQGTKDSIVACFEFRPNADGVAFAWGASSFVPSLDGDNFIRQAYLHLKTLPEFANATDC
jgi:hypothetical protein